MLIFLYFTRMRSRAMRSQFLDHRDLEAFGLYVTGEAGLIDWPITAIPPVTEAR